MFPGAFSPSHTSHPARVLLLTLSPVMPLIVHDIKFVPTEHQRNARLMYFYWLELAATLVFNLLGCLFLWISGAMGGL